MSTEERLPPNYRKLDEALRSIGYSFEVAVADIIDNSIDARARNVLVRLFARKDGHLDLAIWDDGCGMSPATLKEAMRFGADVSRDIDRLGKFGLGLKLASLSQAREVRVVSAKTGRLSGRAWLEHGIAKGFTCTVFDRRECEALVAHVIPDRPLQRSGTLVWWSRLYRVGHHQGGPEEHAQKLMHRLERHLALAFHRFLSGRARKVAIMVDIFEETSGAAGIPITLDALDPFGYDQPGLAGFPATMNAVGRYGKRMAIKAHVWPPNSASANYKLPGGTNARQGFYFYRNHRLIQGGGWNNLREVEPHRSLARVEVDFKGEFDIEISLNIRKVDIELPAELATAIEGAKTASGVDFKKYIVLAEEAYRKRQLTHAELPLIPSVGLPSELTAFLHSQLRLEATARHRDLHIQWRDMEKATFFEIDREGGYLHLNRAYRRQLLHGLPSGGADIPVVKCLLFLVLEDALSSERMGPKIRERVEQVNRILVEAIKYERCPQ